MSFALDNPHFTEFYETFEARETAFNLAVGRLVPVRYRGPRVFWQDFQQIVHAAPPGDHALPAFITSNPRDCLSFGSAAQVLAAARTTARTTACATVHGQGKTGIPFGDALIDQFELQQVLNQPIRTLSGGETVRLSLAKTMALADSCHRLVVSSPFCWLSANHLPLLSLVVDHYTQAGKSARILAMTDETSHAQVAVHLINSLVTDGPAFTLTCRDLGICLETPLNTITSQPRMARVSDGSFQLQSPCLMVGDNGQGKSILAKALCGAVPTEGLAAIAGPHHEGQASLLFQDVVTQTLMRTLPVMARGAWNRVSPQIDIIFHDILNRYAHWADSVQPTIQPPVSAGQEDSLLTVKAMLMAVRLAHMPPALILDEPDWGLSRTAAIALVMAVVEKAHALGVPVMIISHKPWWRPMAVHVLEVTKVEGGNTTQGFAICVRQAGAP